MMHWSFLVFETFKIVVISNAGMDGIEGRGRPRMLLRFG